MLSPCRVLAQPHPGEMASKLWGTFPCSLALLADVTSPATAAKATRTACPGSQVCPGADDAPDKATADNP